MKTNFKKIVIGSILSLTSILYTHNSHAQSLYTASTNVDITNTQIKTELPSTVYRTTAVSLCPVGVTLPDGSTTTVASVTGNLYSVGDVLQLTDGSAIRLTSVNNGQLVANGWEFIAQGVNTTDASSDKSLKYTDAFSSTNTQNHIKNIGSTQFQPGCLSVTGTWSSSPPSSGSMKNIILDNLKTLDMYEPQLITNPDGAWPNVTAFLNTHTSPYGSTYHLSDAARLPLHWGDGDDSPITVNPNNYNNIHIVADGGLWGSVEHVNDTGNAEWNGFDFFVGIPQTALVESFSPEWGHVFARDYTDNRIYSPYGNSIDMALRSPGALETLDYCNHTTYPSCVSYGGWSANTAYTAGTTVSYTDSDKNVYLYTATVSGTSGASSVFTGAETANITDGTVTWTRITGKQSDSTDPRYKNYAWCGEGLRALNHNIVNLNADVDTNDDTTAINVSVTSSGRNGWGTFDIDQYNYMMQKGTNWAWTMVNQLSEIGSIGLGYVDPTNNNNWVSAGKMNYVQEWDMSGIGIEDPSTYYDPTHGNRIAFWFSDWVNGGLNWGDNSKTVQGQQILIARDSNNIPYMYTARNDCTEGDAEPKWAFNETTDVVDGTCHWVYSKKARLQISRFLGVDGGERGNDINIEFGTMFASAATIYNAAIDFSKIVFTDDVDDGIHTLIRSPQNAYWDGSADGTRNGQNNNLFGFDGHWTFKTKQSDGSYASSFAVFSGKNAYRGTLDAFHYNLTPTGNSLSTATMVDTKYTVDDTVSADGLGLRLAPETSIPGTISHIKNDTNKMINLWPIDGGWAIAGADTYGDPVQILPDMDISIVYNGNSSQVIERLDGHAYQLYSLTDANITELSGPAYRSNGVVLFDSDKHTPIAYDARNGDWMSISDIPYNATQTLTTIANHTHSEGERVWCHDCRAPGEATGAGTGRWIYLNSKSVWKTDDGLDASN